jgi:Family of unknown function (DUF5995)
MVVTAPVAAVIERMQAILSPLAPKDGVACFTRLYLAVTEGVQRNLAGVTFADPPFLERLDVVFADLFFAAVDDAARDPATMPHAWAPLFEARTRKGVAPLQFALAGMNAHINRDLPIALVTCCAERGVTLDDDTPQHADFVRVNTVLVDVEAQIRQQFLSGWLRRIDAVVHRLHRIDDVVAMWDVARARDAAWANAQALWAIRGATDLYDDYLLTLDRTVGFAGRGLLVPAETVLMRVGRRLGLA